jgi:hypothetical protein
MYEVYFKVHNSGSFTTINGSKVIFKAKRINEESTLEASGFVSLGRGPYGLHKFIEMIDFDASITNSTGRINHELTKLKNNGLVLLHIQKNDSVWPKCYQVQQKADTAGDIICMNGLWATECTDKVKFTIPKMQTSNEKPAGEWNSMEVLSKNGTLTVYINGTLQNKVTGLTKTKGFIGFQAEGREMEFRQMEIKKL